MSKKNQVKDISFRQKKQIKASKKFPYSSPFDNGEGAVIQVRIYSWIAAPDGLQ